MRNETITHKTNCSRYIAINTSVAEEVNTASILKKVRGVYGSRCKRFVNSEFIKKFIRQASLSLSLSRSLALSLNSIQF